MAPRKRVNDTLKWGYSLSNVFELVSACLDAAGTKTVLEIGSYEGVLTADLLDWAETSGAHIAGVDPVPPDLLEELAAERPELELIRELSLDVLRDRDLDDAIIIDGDHNYYTLHSELQMIGERAPGAELPLLMFHDVCWPHARRDTYYAPERIPEEHRQEVAGQAGVAPDEPGLSEWGLTFTWAAAREGGPGNGTLTAIEDFMKERERLEFAVVPAFFGFGVMWHKDAPYAEAVSEVIRPWDGNPIIERLEHNRVEHLVAGQARQRQLVETEKKLAKCEDLLRRLLGSGAFTAAEKFSGLKQRGEPMYSRAEVQALLDIEIRPGASAEPSDWVSDEKDS